MGNKKPQNKKVHGIRYKVTGTTFVGIITTNNEGKIIKTPPILNWALYRRIDDIMLKALRRKWKVERL